jgi:hypothetical protein
MYRIERVYLQAETLGSFYGLGMELIAKTMELPWKDNRRSISCIPEGIYKVIKQPPKESRPYPYFRLPNVSGRSGILIHRITYVKDLKGCIGVGAKFMDLNKDGNLDMIESSRTLAWMTENLPDEFELQITEKPI